MSYENRKREFKRLMDAGREKDIPQSLFDEFKPHVKIEDKKPIQVKSIKKVSKK
jgi:hypothetical protein